MGVKGAALATVISQGVSVLLCIIYILKKTRILLPSKEHFKVDRPLYNEMLAGNSMMLWQSGNIYGYGDYGTHVQDFLAGGMEIDQVIELLDSATAENARVAGDSNW